MSAASRKDLPPPNTGDVLRRRFSLADDQPAPVSAPPHTSHTAHTPPVASAPPAAAGERRSEPEGMTRRTYYYSKRVADALAAAVDRIHYGSHGRISKAAALDAIITAGVDQADEIERTLRETR